VLSAEDPVRAFQNFATIDLLSRGRAEMIVGRGSSIEAFPLFGYRLEDYDALFEEKLGLLLDIREHEHVHWSGKFRPALTGQGVYPRPVQSPLPIWIGVGGTPHSFARAGALGLPLMVASIGGEPRRFRPLIDSYRETGERSGHRPEQLKVGVHMLGYVGNSTQEAADTFYPGYARVSGVCDTDTMKRLVSFVGGSVRSTLRRRALGRRRGDQRWSTVPSTCTRRKARYES